MTTQQNFPLTATTFHGLEQVLADELKTLGATDIEIGKRAVYFTGNQELLYKANLCLRTAIRILKPIAEFRVRHESPLYNKIQKIDWSKYMDVTDTLAVDSVVSSNYFKHSKYVALKVKDAIVDQFRERFKKRPNVNTLNPTLRINIHLMDDNCIVSLDSSGDSLHKRGYRTEPYKAPLNEVLAAGMILLSGWKADCDLIDGMCGSGTILIEATKYARNIAPNKYRREFGFKNWKDYDAQLWETVHQEAVAAERPFTHTIKGFDIAFQAVRISERNIERAHLAGEIAVKRKDFEKNIPTSKKGILLLNPPYGERIDQYNINAFYAMIGDHLKDAFTGWDVWMISSNMEALKSVGLRPSQKVMLYNGALECSFRHYEMYKGTREV